MLWSTAYVPSLWCEHSLYHLLKAHTSECFSGHWPLLKGATSPKFTNSPQGLGHVPGGGGERERPGLVASSSTALKGHCASIARCGKLLLLWSSNSARSCFSHFPKGTSSPEHSPVRLLHSKVCSLVFFLGTLWFSSCL